MIIDLEHTRGPLEYTLIHVRFRNGRSITVRLDEAVRPILSGPGLPPYVAILSEDGSELRAGITVD